MRTRDDRIRNVVESARKGGRISEVMEDAKASYREVKRAETAELIRIDGNQVSATPKGERLLEIEVD